jgi:hypothetical protein
MTATEPDVKPALDGSVEASLVRTHYVWLVALGALFLRGFRLGHQSFWYDEGFALSLSDGSLSENLGRLVGTESGDRYQMLYYLILGMWRDVVGDSEVAIRLLSVAAGVAVVALVYAGAHRLFGVRRARWSAVIASFSAFGVFYGQEARPYALLMLVAGLQLYLIGRVATGAGGRFAPLWLALTSAVGAFVSVMLVAFTGAVALAHLIAYWDGRAGLRKWWNGWWPSVVGLIPAAVYYGASQALLDPAATEVTRTGAPLVQNALYVAYGIVVGTTFGPPQEALRGTSGARVEVVLSYWPLLAVLLLACVAGLWLLMMAIRRSSTVRGAGSRNASFLVLVLAFSYAASLVFALYTGINWLPRHSSFLAVPFWMLMPYIAGRTWDGSHVTGRWRSPGTWVLIVVLGMNAWALGNYYFNDAHTRDEYRQVAAYLSAEVEPDESVVLLRGTARLFELYASPPVIDLTETMPGSLVDAMAPNLAAGDVWLVLNRPFWWDGAAPLTDSLAGEAVLSRYAEFPYFEVYRFESPAAR